MESKLCEPMLMMVPATMKLLKHVADSLMALSSLTFDPAKAHVDDLTVPAQFRVGMERPLDTEEEFGHATETAKHMAQLAYAYIDRMGNAQLMPMYESMGVWDKIHDLYTELIHDIDLIHKCKETWAHDKFEQNYRIIEIANQISRIMEKFNEQDLKLAQHDVDEICCYMYEYFELGCVVWDFKTSLEELTEIADEGDVILNKLKTAISYLKLNKTNNQENVDDIMEHGEGTTEVPCIPVPGDKICAENHAIQAASGSGEITDPKMI